VTHYDVLGVSRTATEAEMRRAYLGLVRAHHPDRHAESAPAERAAAEDRMRRVNQAWAELGDPERRRRYDEVLDLEPRVVIVGDDGPSTWQPFEVDDDFVDDRLDDSDRRPPRGGRLLTMAPPVVLGLGVGLVVLGIVVGLRELLAVGVMGIILGAGLFVIVPLNIILESRQNDLH
jgi:hypothetical protein